MLPPRPTADELETPQPELPTSNPEFADNVDLKQGPNSKSRFGRIDSSDLADDGFLDSPNRPFHEDDVANALFHHSPLNSSDLDDEDFNNDPFDNDSSYSDPFDSDSFDNEGVNSKVPHHGAAGVPRRQPRYSRMAGYSVTIPARIAYAVITAVIYGLVGMLIDLIIALGRSFLIIGADHSVFWLFAPFAVVIGAMIGTFAMCLTDTDSNNSYRSGRIRLPYLDPQELQQDINRGLGKVVGLLVIIGIMYFLLK